MISAQSTSHACWKNLKKKIKKIPLRIIKYYAYVNKDDKEEEYCDSLNQN